MKILSLLEKNIDTWFLLIISFIFFLFRLPSLFEPYWYGDEGITQVIGIALKSGRILYRDIVDNKPPLLYYLYSIFDSEQFYLKLLSLIFGLLSIIAFFYLAKKLFSKSPFLITTLFAIFFGIPIIEGNIANAENFMAFPTILSGLLILNVVTRPNLILNTRYLILFFSGLLTSVSFLFKAVAMFDFAAFFLFLFYISFPQKNYLKTLIIFLSGFLLPIILTTFYFVINGAFKDLVEAALSQNISYIGKGSKMLLKQLPFLTNLSLLTIFLIAIFKLKEKLSKTTIFILLWFGFSLFNLFFSPRHYTHYLLVLLPSALLLLQLVFWNKKYRKLLLALFVFSLILISSNFRLYKNSFRYYQNFLSFITNQKDVENYQAFFDRHTPTDYKLMQYINSKATSKDQLYIWGNNAQLYKMTNKLPPGKYTAAYHVSYYQDGISDTKKALEKTHPKFIIIMPNQPQYPFSLMNYTQKINLDNVTIYERIF